MADIDQLIDKFIKEEISLSTQDISSSAKSREWLINQIQAKINKKLAAGEVIPSLYNKEPFLNFGSYFKKTKVRNVDEFDILVVIDSNQGVYSSGGVITGYGVGSSYPCHKYNQKFYKSDGSGVSPAKLLNWLKSIVTEVVQPFGGETPLRNGQAVTAYIKSQNLKIDLVPAGVFTLATDDSKFFYNIPDGTSANSWILTHPQNDMAIINYLASERANFRNVIRIIKSIRDDYNFQISSYAIECIVIDYALKDEWSASTVINLCKSLIELAIKVREGKILDVWDSSANLIEGLEVNKWYAERIEKIVTGIMRVYEINDLERAYNTLKTTLRNET